MRRHKKLAIAGLLCGATLIAGCESSTSQRMGTLAVKLTDAPFPFDSVARVDVFVLRIDASQGVTSDSNAAENVEASEMQGNGWTTIASPNESFDLLTLRNGVTANLGQATLPIGQYRGFRLVIDTDRSSVTLANGTVLNGSSIPGVAFPSAGTSGIKINMDEPVTVTEGTTTMLVDFDVGQSFVLRGNSIAQQGLLFKPVIKASVLQ